MSIDYVSGSLTKLIAEIPSVVMNRDADFNTRLLIEIKSISDAVDKLINLHNDIKKQLLVKDNEIVELKNRPNNEEALRAAQQEKQRLTEELKGGMSQLTQLKDALSSSQAMPIEVANLRKKIDDALGQSGSSGNSQTRFGGSKKYKKSKKRRKYKKNKSRRK